MPVDKKIPDCPYQILDTVCLLDVTSPLAVAAYQTAGKENLLSEEANSSTLNRTALQPADFKNQLPAQDAWSEVDNSTLASKNIAGSTSNTLSLINTDPAANVSTPYTVTYNSCSMNTDVNYPSGRITVEETQWGNGGVAYEGVADIKIEVLGPNGQRVVAQTNRYGCFKATGAIRGFRPIIGPRLPVIMNVIFESGRKEIRGYNDWTNTAQYSKPLLHIYGNISYSMNSANVSYEKHTGSQDNDTKYYVAATVNNALYEFDDCAAQDGILSPPNNLKILVHRYAGEGAAPMFNKMSNSNPVEMSVIKGFFMAGVGLGSGILFGDPVTMSMVAANFAHFAPDVAIGYGWSNSSDFSTDQIKEIAYHEFAHASHYRNAGFNMWLENIKFVTTHNGYGNPGDNGVERTDLIEMWGYFIGRDYAHRRYGPNAHSQLSVFAVGAPNFNNSWFAWNENNNNGSLFDWTNHIASGFLHDLIDDNIYNTTPPRTLQENPSITSDNITGYSIGSIFGQMDASTNSAPLLVEKLRNNLPFGNSIGAFDSLKNSYGY